MYGRDFITDLTPFFSNKATLCTSRYSDTLLGETFWPVSKNTSSVFHKAVTIRTDILFGGMWFFFTFSTPKKRLKCISYLRKTCTAPEAGIIGLDMRTTGQTIRFDRKKYHLFLFFFPYIRSFHFNTQKKPYVHRSIFPSRPSDQPVGAWWKIWIYWYKIIWLETFEKG